MTIEQLRREVVRCARGYAPDPVLRDAFDAYDKARDAANKPTFEGDEAEVREWLQSWLNVSSPGPKAIRALLDAKDAEIEYERELARCRKNGREVAKKERDAALSRAEQAEVALAERDAAIVEACRRADEPETPDWISEPLRPFLPAKPADPLAEIVTDLWDFDHRAAAELRAAIERAGGVKAVFGEVGE